MVYVLSYVYFLAAILCFVVPVPVNSAPLPNISRIDTSSAGYSAPGPRRSAESSTITFEKSQLLREHYGVNHARYGVNLINKHSKRTDGVGAHQQKFYLFPSLSVHSNNIPNINEIANNNTSVSSTILRSKRELNQNNKRVYKNIDNQYHHQARRRHRHRHQKNTPDSHIPPSFNTITNDDTIQTNRSSNPTVYETINNTEHPGNHHLVNVPDASDTGIDDDSVKGVDQTRVRASREASSGRAMGHNEHEIDENAGRNERSTNQLQISGTERKIHMHINKKYLQILPDGTVNGGKDKTIYTIMRRTSIRIGSVKIQAIATCQYICMDECGILYGSREFNDECAFNETIWGHNQNIYFSTRYSSKNRILYLAIGTNGVSRRVQMRSIKSPLGILSEATSVLPMHVDLDQFPKMKVKQCTWNDSQTATSSTPSSQSVQHPVRHQHGVRLPQSSINTNTSGDAKKFLCRKRRKRKNFKARNGKNDKNRHEKSIDGNGEPLHRKHLQTSSNHGKRKRLKSANNTRAACDLGSTSNSEKCISGIDKTRNNSKEFIFNGVPHRNCDEYKNINKKRKCELAQRRQRTKTANSGGAGVGNSKTSARRNFQSGEVDATIKTNARQTVETISRPALKTLNQNAAEKDFETDRMEKARKVETSPSNSNTQNGPSQVFGDGSSSPSWGIDGDTVDDVHFVGDSIDPFLEDEYDWMPEELGRNDFGDERFEDSTTLMTTLPDSSFSGSPPPDNLNDDYGSSMLDDV